MTDAPQTFPLDSIVPSAPPPGDTEAMVQAALSQLGVPYGWGTESPGVSFDCSGLTQWAAGQAGITIGRTTYQQVFNGDPVVGAPQRGDLVFPEAGHVVIALGGDQCVHAPTDGEVVKISTYWTAPYAIRRLGPNSGSVTDTTTAPQYQAANDGTQSPSLSSLVPGYAQLQAEIKNLDQSVSNQLGMFSKISDTIKTLSTFFNLLMSQQGWVRIGQVVAGTAAILLGLAWLMKEFAERIV